LHFSAAAVGGIFEGGKMRMEPHSKLVMIGDSITDCGRDRTVPEATDEGLGNGYVSLVNAWLQSGHAEARIRVVNKGISGNTVRDLKRRWQEDVLDCRPDWLSIMIGINDVWRHFDSSLPPEEQVELPEFESTVDALVQQTQPGLRGLVLCTPFFIETNPNEPMRHQMDAYGAAVRRVAQKRRTVLVDTQAAFDAVLTRVHPMAFARDRVHPGLPGHAVLARAFLQAIECA
jgi:lysophospholipase L1-like esterase